MASFSDSYLRCLIPSKGSFRANLFALMTGTTLAQTLVVASAPILTRFYTPADFGIYAIYISLTGILAVVAGWRYEIAIMLPRDDTEATNILALACVIVLGMSTATLIVVALFRHPIALLLKAPELATWLWWTPLSLFLSGIYQALNYWCNRKKQFKRLAVSRGGQAAGSVGLQVGAGLLGMGGVSGLVTGNLVGQAVGVALLSLLLGRNDGVAIRKSISLHTMRDQAQQYSRFPMFDSWSGLAILGVHQLPPLFLNFFFGAATAGFYSLGYRVLNLPLLLVNTSFAQVFFQRYEEKRKTAGKEKFLRTSIKALAAVAALPSLILFFFAPWLFKFIFGPEWEVSGEYIMILTPLLFCRFISSPVSTVFWSEGKNSWLFYWQSSLMIMTVLSFVSGGIFGSIILALILFSVLGSLLYLLSIVLVLRSSIAAT